MTTDHAPRPTSGHSPRIPRVDSHQAAADPADLRSVPDLARVRAPTGDQRPSTPSRTSSDEALLASGLFQGIDRAEARTLLRLLIPTRFRCQDLIFGQGQPSESLYVITEGRVRIYQTARDGRLTMLMLAGPSDMIGALSLFDPGPRTTTAKALTDVEAHALDREGLHTWIHSCPAVSERLLQILTRRLRRTDLMISDRIHTDVPARVAKTLLRLAADLGTPTRSGILVEHHMTQAELADLIGAARETVNKALNAFVARGWIRLDTGSVDILQPDRLARRAR